MVACPTIFGLLGIIIGLWAKNFEQLTVLNVFFITPLSFVGGVFNTVRCCRAGCAGWPTEILSFIS